MALSGITGVSGISGIVSAEEVSFELLNTDNLLARFATANSDFYTLANATAVSTWSPIQLGPIASFDLTRGNTVNSQSPQLIPNDGRFNGFDTFTFGFNNKSFYADNMNAAFANSSLTTHVVMLFDAATPRSGIVCRYRNPGSPFFSAGLETRNVGGNHKLRWSTFDVGGAGNGDTANTFTNAAVYIITWYKTTTNRQVIRVNGREEVNTFEQTHWNTVGSGRRLDCGGSGTGTITSECTPSTIADLSFYRNHDPGRVDDVEATLADTYGVTLL